MPPTPTTRQISSGDIRLAVREHSASGPGRPTVVLVHGYPDQQDTWDTLVARLPLDAWHVVTYDVRGAGGSQAPVRRQDYVTDRLVDDLVAVLDAVLPEGQAAHLVGHDWGSVQLWDAVAAEPTDPRLRGRIATFTSISGPSLDHAAWLGRHPAGRQLRLLRQAAHSWYIGFFNLPLLPESVLRLAHAPLGRAIEAREHLPSGHFGPALERNAVNGLNLYRANVLGGTRRSGPVRVSLPVLVVQPTRDRFLTDLVVEDLQVGCSDLRVQKIDAGHWVIVTHADDLARLLEEHVNRA
jgi:pimeloyl-ACP methyl ester carboxylesterase